MLFAFAVAVPLLVQLLFTLMVVFATNGTGSFVGLGAMLVGLLAIPLTALANWVRTRRKPPLPPLQLINRTLLTTLVFPALVLVLLAVAS